MLIVHATIPVLPEQRESFLGAVGGLVEASNAEPGVLSYALHEAIATPNTFVMVETYVDDAAFAEHLSSAHFQAAAQHLPGWLSAPPEVVKYEAQDGVEVHLG